MHVQLTVDKRRKRGTFILGYREAQCSTVSTKHIKDAIKLIANKQALP
jgi:hypothetical protein